MKKIIIIVGIVIVIGALALTAVITSNKIKSYQDEIETLTAQNADLQVKASQYSDISNYFTIRDDVGTISAGTIFDKSCIVPVQVPTAALNDSYVLDLAQLENKLYKVDVEPGTPLIFDLFMDEPVQPTDRYVDVVLNDYPVGAKTGDYYDIRFRTQSGLDYIVLSKKRVIAHYSQCLKMTLNEEEILLYGSALFDEVFNEGGMLYATVYVEPSVQKGAQMFYAPSPEMIGEMQIDPNLVTLKYQELYNKRADFESHLNVHDETDYAKASKLFQDIIKAHTTSEADYIAAKAEQDKNASSNSDNNTSESSNVSSTNSGSNSGDVEGTSGGLSVGIAQNNNVSATGQDLSEANGSNNAYGNITSGANILNP